MESSIEFEMEDYSEGRLTDNMMEDVLEAQIQAAYAALINRFKEKTYHEMNGLPRIRKRDSIEDFLIRQNSH